MTSRRTFLQGAAAAAAASALSTAGRAQPAIAAPTGPNAQAFQAILAADPRLVAVRPLRKVRRELSGRVLTHAGPPVDWAHMSGPQQGASIAFTLFEGWASTPQAAEAMLASGRIRLEANHDHHGVGGMAGVASPSTLVYVVQDATSGRDAYCLNEMLAHYGTYGPIAQDELGRWQRIYMPAIGRAIPDDGLPLKSIEASAINSGDDLHCRDLAASDRWWATQGPAIIRTSSDADAAATGEVLAAFPNVAYLGLGMAAAKATMRAAEGIPGSTVVTVMARNGTDVGIQLASMPGRWFTAPAPPIDFVPINPDTRPADACHDLGDSAIRETVGTGANAAIAAPFLAHEIGLTVPQMAEVTDEMARVCVGRRTDLPIAALDLTGPPVGVEVGAVLDTGITPRIFTAVAPNQPEPNVDNFLGLGRSRIPLECFQEAAAALAR
jgi:hypothetical protein